jgi:hypothetical protein
MDDLEKIRLQHEMLGNLLEHSRSIDDPSFTTGLLSGLSEALGGAGANVLSRLSTDTCELWSRGLDDRGASVILKMLKDPFWSKYLLSLTLNDDQEKEGEFLRPTELSWKILRTLYFFDIKRRYPELYESLQIFMLEALTNKLNLYDTVQVSLALYGHSKILKNPVLLRVYAPPSVGLTKKGKKETCPQKDLALLVYNPVEILSKGTTQAIVCLDGCRFSTLDIDHTRVRMIQRDSLVSDTIHTGIYESKGVRLPLCGVQPFWQLIAKKLLEIEIGQISRTSEKFATLERGLLESSRFLGERFGIAGFKQKLYAALGEAGLPIVRSTQFEYEDRRYYDRAFAVLTSTV